MDVSVQWMSQTRLGWREKINRILLTLVMNRNIKLLPFSDYSLLGMRFVYRVYFRLEYSARMFIPLLYSNLNKHDLEFWWHQNKEVREENWSISCNSITFHLFRLCHTCISFTNTLKPYIIDLQSVLYTGWVVEKICGIKFHIFHNSLNTIAVFSVLILLSDTSVKSTSVTPGHCLGAPPMNCTISPQRCPTNA